MTARTARWALLPAALAGGLLLGGCQVDADGDGIDDNTGQPTFQDCHTLAVGCKGDPPEHPDTSAAPLPEPPPSAIPQGEGGWPVSCPQDITVTYGDTSDDVTKVEVITYDGTDEDPVNVQAHEVAVSGQCRADLNRESREFTGWLNTELDKRGAR